MPGYDRTRFVCISESDLQEFICGICLDVFIKPPITECCGQTYCYDCINEWVSQNKSCPFDRKRITQNQLKSAPKILINLLGNMKIKCDYQDKGCNSVITVTEQASHIKNHCLYNFNRNCDKCGLTMLNHTEKICNEQLSAKLKETSNKLEKLQKDYDNITKEKRTTQQISGSFVTEILEKFKNLEKKFNELEIKFNTQITKSPQNLNWNKNIQDGLVWVKSSNGVIPNNAVIGGKNEHGNPIYIGRVMHIGNVIPGWILPSFGNCYIGYKGRSFANKEYEVLTNPNNCHLEWIPCYGQLLSGAIEGGQEDDHFKLFIGRTSTKDGLLLGKVVGVDSFTKTLYFPCNGKELEYNKFEILVSNENN